MADAILLLTVANEHYASVRPSAAYYSLPAICAVDSSIKMIILLVILFHLRMLFSLMSFLPGTFLYVAELKMDWFFWMVTDINVTFKITKPVYRFLRYTLASTKDFTVLCLMSAGEIILISFSRHYSHKRPTA